MLAYYFFRYWSRGLVGIMIAVVVGYFGIFSFSLTAAQNTERKNEALVAENQRIATRLSITPPVNSSLVQQDIEQTHNTYKKSLKVFEQIQELKSKKQDTTELETLYAASVKHLSNQNYKEAEAQLDALIITIADMSNMFKQKPTQTPTGIPTLSPVPSETNTPSPEADKPVDTGLSPTASASAKSDELEL